MIVFKLILINSLALNNNFSYRNVFQNSVNSFFNGCKNTFLFVCLLDCLFVCLFVLFCFVLFFVKKAQNFMKFGPYDFIQILLAYGTIFCKECMERL